MTTAAPNDEMSALPPKREGFLMPAIDLATELNAHKNLLIGIERRLRKGAPNPMRDARRKIVKSIVCVLHANKSPGGLSEAEAFAKRLYPGSYPEIQNTLRVPSGVLKTRAAIGPAVTSDPAWAGDLVGDGDFYLGAFATLAPQSVLSQLGMRGLRVDLPNSGRLRIPTSQTTDPPPVFIGEGDPIPARRGWLANTSLSAKKAALLSVYTNELLKRSVPTIEAVVSRMLAQDVARGIDKQLLSSNAATADAPAGILVGAIPVAAAALADPQASMVLDIGDLVGALADPAAATNPVLIANPIQATRYGLYGASGPPMIASEFVPAGTVIALDAGDFVVGYDSTSFNIDVSDESLIHESDAAEPIVDSSVIASPVRSLYQTDCAGLRLIEGLDWGLTSPAAVITDVSW